MMENRPIMNRIAISKRECVLNLRPKVRPDEFGFIQDENNCPKVVKIEAIFGESAHVKYYIWGNELESSDACQTENGSRIEFGGNEVIEDTTKSENIKKSRIFAKCAVIKAREHESLAELLQNRTKNSMAYVCRYKLVKDKDGYRLEPVSWQPGEEEQRDAIESDYDEQNAYTDTDTQSEAVLDLNATIEQIHLNLTNDDIEPPSPRNGMDYRAIRTQNHKTKPDNKRSSPDATLGDQDVSPSKRNKFNDSRESLESPEICAGKYATPALDQMKKIKKNLNRSMGFAADASMDVDDTPGSPYVPEYKNNNPMRMTLRKESKKEQKTPLKDITYDNTASGQELANTSEIPFNVAQHEMAKSAHRTRSSSRSNQNHNVSLDTTAMRNNSITRTPSRREPREAAQKARMKMVESSDSPEQPPPRTRRQTIAVISTPSTPKAKSTSQTLATPRSTTRHTKGVMTPQQSRSAYRAGNLTPSIQSRTDSIGRQQTELEMIRERLQVSAVPSSLPCREKEFSSIYEFIIGKLKDGSGGCIYISGVPGTGKTATVTQVIKTIQSELKPKKLPAFDFVDINGMRLTEPRQAYVQIYRQLTGKTLAWAQARDLLETRFTAGAKKSIRPTILLVDELDIICNRKQDVVYNLFDWTVRKGARLIAITIANTMDLPERVLKLKVASRLGLTRITFQPYTFKQLQEVVMTRLAGSNCFMADAVQLVARKVASVSGDCRRALDICRRATEIAEEKSTKKKIEINFGHITQALNEMFASPKVRAIKNSTNFEKLFLQAVASEITRTGIEEVEFQRVYWQIGTLAPVLGIKHPPTEDQAMLICMTLAANRLLIAEDSSAGLYQKIMLNATVDDLYYALNGS